MIAIIDYGVGNLFSLQSSLKYIGEECLVTGSPAEIARCGKIVFPGVGAFGDASGKLRETGLDAAIRREAAAGKPLLGICLGMQLLLEKSYEYGEYDGLGLIKGSVVPIPQSAPPLKIPQMGWNALLFPADKPKNRLFRYVEEGEHVYFVHSYYATDCDYAVIARTEYGALLTAAVAADNVYGVQFHPEKSGRVGLNILRAFAEL